MQLDKKRYWRARKFALELSRGKIPERQCSPYGGLATDLPALQERAREMYEVLIEAKPLFAAEVDNAK